MKQESKYFGLIELINSGCEVNTSSDSGNTTPNPFEQPTPNPFGHIFEVDI